MKPSVPVARARDYVVADAPLAEAARFIRAHHYARGCANTAVFVHGLYRDGGLVGAALWLPPTRVCATSVHPDWRRVLALSRLAVAPSEPQNAESILLGASLRRIRATRRWAALVTFAEEERLGHRGTIYRATNWTDAGLTRREPAWVNADGRQVARKSAGKSRTAAQMRALGFVCLGSFRKRKFTLTLEPSP